MRLVDVMTTAIEKQLVRLHAFSGASHSEQSAASLKRMVNDHVLLLRNVRQVPIVATGSEEVTLRIGIDTVRLKRAQQVAIADCAIVAEAHIVRIDLRTLMEDPVKTGKDMHAIALNASGLDARCEQRPGVEVHRWMPPIEFGRRAPNDADDIITL